MLGVCNSAYDLGSLFVENPDGAMDGILNECTAYDYDD
jgi:hypothetical protein